MAGKSSGRRRDLGIAALLVAAALTPVGTASAEPANEQPTAPAAVDAARKLDKRVEVSTARSQTREVFANPSGTFTEVLHPRPVRAKRADGSWTAVDTKLVTAADGSVTPAASLLAAKLPGGGNGPIATLNKGGNEFPLWVAGHAAAAGTGRRHRDLSGGAARASTSKCGWR